MAITKVLRRAGSYTRKHLPANPTFEVVNHLSDEQIHKLSVAQCSRKVYAAYNPRSAQGQPRAPGKNRQRLMFGSREGRTLPHEETEKRMESFALVLISDWDEEIAESLSAPATVGKRICSNRRKKLGGFLPQRIVMLSRSSACTVSWRSSRAPEV